MNRKLPKYFIVLLDNWYSKLKSTVKWGNVFSSFKIISSGVRQGGILSPSLIILFVDDVLKKLESSKLGCSIQGLH